MKRLRYNGKSYKVTGFTKGALPLAKAKYYHPRGRMKGWHEVKNLSIRRALAKKLGK